MYIGSVCFTPEGISGLRQNPSDITCNWTERVQITSQTALQLYYMLICTNPIYVKKSKTISVLSFLAKTTCYKLYPKQKPLYKTTCKDSLECLLFPTLFLSLKENNIYHNVKFIIGTVNLQIGSATHITRSWENTFAGFLFYLAIHLK